MSIFGKDHYIKFCITTFSYQKMAEGGSIQVSKITLIITSCAIFCAVVSTSKFRYVTFLGIPNNFMRCYVAGSDADI